MVKPCEFLRLVHLHPDGIRDEIVIRVDSITYINCALGTVFIQYRGDGGKDDILIHREEYDSSDIAFERFFMILKIMGAVGQTDLKRYFDSAKRREENSKEVKS